MYTFDMHPLEQAVQRLRQLNKGGTFIYYAGDFENDIDRALVPVDKLRRLFAVAVEREKLGQIRLSTQVVNTTGPRREKVTFIQYIATGL